MTVKTYAAGRLLEISSGNFRRPHDNKQERGELVPEAHLWLRMESFAHTGHLKEVEVEEDEFREAVEKYCPEQADEIYLRVGLTKGTQLEGNRQQPAKAAGPKPGRSNESTKKVAKKVSKPEAKPEEG